ncbi:stage II sporulation protein M [Brevibacillus sp. SYSU BS000544]|uniref:stage II sporulation protein M n=1 Tax=Brevibacillus sp. SYSU BS000544 TaxID=3416443 RepID=UPI003CE4D3F8
MRARIGQTIRNFMKENQSLYVFTVVLITMGVIFGAVIVNSLSLEQKQELFGFLQYFFRNIDQNGIADPNQQFQQAMGYYVKTVGIMWIFGLSIIGVPMILLLLFLKGIVIGFTVGFLVNQFQWDGVLFALAGVLPQNMLVIPAFVIIGVAGIAFSLRLIKTRLISNNRGPILPYFFSYSMLVLVMFGILTLAALFESYISPSIMQYVIK